MNSMLEVVEFVGETGRGGRRDLREKRLGSTRGERRSGWKEEKNLGISVVSVQSEVNLVL